MSVLLALFTIVYGASVNERILVTTNPIPQLPAETCAQLISKSALSEGDEEKLLLCQLYESSTLLAQLGVLVSEGLDRLILSQAAPEDGSDQREKRKHEYLRFGKRKHEYLRFGKRKHEYLRFG